MRKVLTLLALSATLLLLALALTATGCGSEAVTTTQATTPPPTAAQAPTTAASEPTTTATTSSVAAAIPTTSEPSSPITTEPFPGESWLDEGHVGGFGYIEQVRGQGNYLVLHVIYVDILTGDDAKTAAITDGKLAPGEELPSNYYVRVAGVPPEDPVDPEVDREARNEVSPTISITTYTLAGGGGEQTLTWEEFRSLYDLAGSNPINEQVGEAIWWIERDAETTEIVSISEHVLP